MNKFPILGNQINVTSYEDCKKEIVSWTKDRIVRQIFAANVHMVMTAYDDPEFQNIVNSADLVTPDGMPLVWALRLKGFPDQERVYGPTLMLKVLEAASIENIDSILIGDRYRILR